MTRNEAKWVLELIRDRYSSVDVDRYSLTDAETDAIYMAIEALDTDAVPMEYHERCVTEEIQKRANMVEVVRCKDCKYADMSQDDAEEDDVFCFHFSMGFMNRDDFCSWGERREDDKG